MDLDDFLGSIPVRKSRSARALPAILREAYTYNVPALIMKSSTDRLSRDGGYSFFLGTPDDAMRRIASWLITRNSDAPENLAALIRPLWERHGREDIAMCALLLANIDHARTETSPWKLLEESLMPYEPVEGLLLCVEEILRSGRQPPSEDQINAWLHSDGVLPTLALLCIHASMMKGRMPTEKERKILRKMDELDTSELTSRIRMRILDID
ncbi:MAG: hypothetical protein VX515_04010 [Candidatus Thermoplasmatota archaeon]|nr:hypothetical protein [Candidatus Thermoplasmatota archaeon]